VTTAAGFDPGDFIPFLKDVDEANAQNQAAAEKTAEDAGEGSTTEKPADKKSAFNSAAADGAGRKGFATRYR
jgi:hypothetical protein